MLSYNEATQGARIIYEGEPYEVIASTISKKSRQKASNQVKMKSLRTGRVIEVAFHQSDNLEEAPIDKRTIVFIYARGDEVFFHEQGDKSARFALPRSLVEGQLPYLKSGGEVDALVFDDEVIGITLPIKLDLLVEEAAPAVKGNTAQNATKQVTLEGGIVVTVPLFVNQGDVVRVNTETGAYVERVTKAG
ncbi:elongation factor P [Patescibacteria group bacterium]|jgi:elongation factor P|nr:elongation factor P [Patescibacteria group bacterium]